MYWCYGPAVTFRHLSSIFSGVLILINVYIWLLYINNSVFFSIVVVLNVVWSSNLLKPAGF